MLVYERRYTSREGETKIEEALIERKVDETLQN